MKNAVGMPSGPGEVLTLSLRIARRISEGEKVMRLSWLEGCLELVSFGSRQLSVVKFCTNVFWKIDAFASGSEVREPSLLNRGPIVDFELNLLLA